MTNLEEAAPGYTNRGRKVLAMNQSRNPRPMKLWQIRKIEESIADLKAALSLLEYAERNREQSQLSVIWTSRRFLEITISELQELTNTGRRSQ